MSRHDSSSILKLLVNYLAQPASDFYLPSFLYKNSLDPWYPAEIQLPPLTILGMAVDITLGKIVCRGLSNMRVKGTDDDPDVEISGDTATFHAEQPNTDPQYHRPPDVPNQVILTAQKVDVTLDSETMPPGSGTVTIQQIQDISGTFTVDVDSSEDLNSVTVTFTAFSVNPSVDNQNIQVKLDFDTAFIDTINQIINEPDNLTTVIQKVNDALNQPDTLAAVSKAATSAAQSALKNILQANDSTAHG